MYDWSLGGGPQLRSYFPLVLKPPYIDLNPRASEMWGDEVEWVITKVTPQSDSDAN